MANKLEVLNKIADILVSGILSFFIKSSTVNLT